MKQALHDWTTLQTKTNEKQTKNNQKNCLRKNTVRKNQKLVEQLRSYSQQRIFRAHLEPGGPKLGQTGLIPKNRFFLQND